MSKTASAFRHALTVRNVVARALVAMDEVAMEFATPEAMEKYLKAHPKADKGKHTVKKPKDEKGEGAAGGSKERKYDFPETKDKSSPYYIDTSNAHLKSLGDPAEWNYKDAMNLKEKLKSESSKISYKPGSPEEAKVKEMGDAIRMISNWGGLAHSKNRDGIDKDLGMGKHAPAKSQPKKQPKRKYDFPETKDKSSPYYVDTSNTHLKDLGDPAEWNYKDVMNLKEDLKDKASKVHYKPGSPEEAKVKEMSDAVRTISNWGGLAHKRNREGVSEDTGF